MGVWSSSLSKLLAVKVKINCDSVDGYFRIIVANMDTKGQSPSGILYPACLSNIGVWSNDVVPFGVTNVRISKDHIPITTLPILSGVPIYDPTDRGSNYNGSIFLENFSKGLLLSRYDAAAAIIQITDTDVFGHKQHAAAPVPLTTVQIQPLMVKCDTPVIADVNDATTKALTDWLQEITTNSLNFGTKRRSNREMVNNLFPQYFNEHLHYLSRDPSNATQIYEIPLKPGAIDILKLYGKMRFDTKFIRNIFWITNIQRVLRFKLRRDLTWYNSKVVSDHAVIAPSITESYEKDLHQTIDMQNYKY